MQSYYYKFLDIACYILGMKKKNICQRTDAFSGFKIVMDITDSLFKAYQNFQLISDVGRYVSYKMLLIV